MLHSPLPSCSMPFIFTYLQEGKIMPVKYEENSLIWVAVGQPVKDNSFLSAKVIELCGDLPIFWLKPTYPKGNIFTSLHAAWKAACPCEVPGSPSTGLSCDGKWGQGAHAGLSHWPESSERRKGRPEVAGRPAAGLAGSDQASQAAAGPGLYL